jgi:hypothetical protein
MEKRNTGKEMAASATALKAKEDAAAAAKLAALSKPTEKSLQESMSCYNGTKVVFDNGMFLTMETEQGDLIHGEPAFFEIKGNYHEDIAAFVTLFNEGIDTDQLPVFFYESDIMNNIRNCWSKFNGNLEDPSNIQDFYTNRYTMPFKDLNHNDIIYLAMMHASLLDKNKMNFEFINFEDMEAIFSKISNVLYILYALQYAISSSESDHGYKINNKMFRVVNFKNVTGRTTTSVYPPDYYNAMYTFYNDQLFLIALENLPACTQLKAKFIELSK